MLAGTALLGIMTASLASWLVDKVRKGEELDTPQPTPTWSR
jgi:hypothetical protein